MIEKFICAVLNPEFQEWYISCQGDLKWRIRLPMMTCSKIKSLPPKGVYYSLFQSIDAATLTTDWEAKPDQSVVI